MMVFLAMLVVVASCFALAAAEATRQGDAAGAAVHGLAAALVATLVAVLAVQP